MGVMQWSEGIRLLDVIQASPRSCGKAWGLRQRSCGTRCWCCCSGNRVALRGRSLAGTGWGTAWQEDSSTGRAGKEPGGPWCPTGHRHEPEHRSRVDQHNCPRHLLSSGRTALLRSTGKYHTPQRSQPSTGIADHRPSRRASFEGRNTPGTCSGYSVHRWTDASLNPLHWPGFYLTSPVSSRPWAATALVPDQNGKVLIPKEVSGLMKRWHGTWSWWY